MPRYSVPKAVNRVELEIDELGVTILESSFADKMDFLTWLQKHEKDKPADLIAKVLHNNLPDGWASHILKTGNMTFISQIYAEVVANKLGMTVEEYLNQSEPKKV